MLVIESVVEKTKLDQYICQKKSSLPLAKFSPREDSLQAAFQPVSIPGLAARVCLQR
jgi:hypothetical protein